jgi:hypothetical protein
LPCYIAIDPRERNTLFPDTVKPTATRIGNGLLVSNDWHQNYQYSPDIFYSSTPYDPDIYPTSFESNIYRANSALINMRVYYREMPEQHLVYGRLPDSPVKYLIGDIELTAPQGTNYMVDTHRNVYAVYSKGAFPTLLIGERK